MWSIRAIDPETLDIPIDPFIGFLPPDKTPPEGRGFVTYFVSPKKGLVTGAQIEAQASIVFDSNDPVPTNVWVNTIDADLPSSNVVALPAHSESAFTVNWSGTDDGGGSIGSGIATFDIYVSDNGSPFTLWIDDTADQSAAYQGEVGHTYSFYSRATDNVGHEETAPITPDASTLVVTPPRVTSTIVQDGLEQRSYVDRLAIEFDGQMNLVDLIANGEITSAVSLTNLGVDADANPDAPWALSPDQFHYQYDAGSRLSRLTWSLDAFAATTTSLADGNYQLVLDGNLVTGVDGIALDGDGDSRGSDDFVFSFHRLQGDANGNMIVDQADMDIVNAALGATPTSAAWDTNADLDRDNRITVRDRTIVARATGHEIVPPSAGTLAAIVLPGDYNYDGMVDTADFVVWRKNLGNSVLLGSIAGDGDGDRDVDNDDYGVWRSHFGLDAATYAANFGSPRSASNSPALVATSQVAAVTSILADPGRELSSALRSVSPTAEVQVQPPARDEVFAALALNRYANENEQLSHKRRQRPLLGRIASFDVRDLLAATIHAQQDGGGSFVEDKPIRTSTRRVHDDKLYSLEEGLDEVFAKEQRMALWDV